MQGFNVTPTTLEKAQGKCIIEITFKLQVTYLLTTVVQSPLAIVADVEKLIAEVDTNLLTRFIYLH